MTITTAKIARAVRLAWMPPLAAAVLFAPQAQAQMEAAQPAPAPPRGGWVFTPTLELRETYTDNVALEREELAEGQFVTEITPGFTLAHRGPRLNLRAMAQLQYFALQDKDIVGTNRSARRAQGDAKARLVDDLLYLDASGSIAQQGVSPFGPQARGSDYASLNRAEITSWRVSPYLAKRFGSTANAELRYIRDSVSGDLSGLNDTDGNTLSLNVNSGAAFRTLGWSTSVSREHVKARFDRSYSSETASVNALYKYSPYLTLRAGVGYDSYDYEALGGVNSGKSWTAGLAWSPSRRTMLNASIGHRYFGPSRTFSLMHRSRRSVWNVDYSDTVSTTRSNFLLPQTVDTASLLDGLFAPTIADPVERQLAVEAYMRQAGLPPSLDNSINFFTNRFSLQKQLRGSVALRSARSSALFNVYHIRRDALSVRETDGPLVGSSLFTINDNVTQQGVSMALSWRATARTSLNLTADASDQQSRSIDQGTSNKSLRFTVLHRLPAGAVASVEMRRVQGSTLVQNGRNYRENAIAAALSLKL